VAATEGTGEDISMEDVLLGGRKPAAVAAEPEPTEEARRAAEHSV
jgi:hypothetical protein